MSGEERLLALQTLGREIRERRSIAARPSPATSLAHGFAMLTRLFPGARELVAIDDELMLEVLGAPPAGKAPCFEDQYASTGGQPYELLVGHARFNADLRPLMRPLLERRGLPPPLCCHLQDVCTALIANEAGVIVTGPQGRPLDVPRDVDTDVAWVGSPTARCGSASRPALRASLARRALLT